MDPRDPRLCPSLPRGITADRSGHPRGRGDCLPCPAGRGGPGGRDPGLVPDLPRARRDRRPALQPAGRPGARDPPPTQRAAGDPVPTRPPAASRTAAPRRPDTFADWMSSTLRREGLTQEAAARQLGVSVKTVGRWVGGETEPRLRDLRRIQELFGELPFP